MIAISKLCCPACWELIKLLRDITSSPKLAVRGSHPNIYPLVLPPWIPPEIRDKMNNIFLGYLGAELVQLIARPSAEETPNHPQKLGHRRQSSDSSTLSQESGTTLCSVSSSSEAETEDCGFYFSKDKNSRTSKSNSLTWFLVDVLRKWKEANIGITLEEPFE